MRSPTQRVIRARRLLGLRLGYWPACNATPENLKQGSTVRYKIGTVDDRAAAVDVVVLSEPAVSSVALVLNLTIAPRPPAHTQAPIVQAASRRGRISRAVCARKGAT